MKLREIIHHASLAPSGHNTQPWKFSAEENTIRMYPDFERRLEVADSDNHALYLSLGCALENLVIAAGKNVLKSRVGYFPEEKKEECIRVIFSPGGESGDKGLFDAIPARQTNRSFYYQKEIPSNDLQKLADANQNRSVLIKTISTKDKKSTEPITELVKKACRIQFSDREFVEELVSWIRLTKKEARNRKDGLTAEVMGFPNMPRWLGRLIIKMFARPGSEAPNTEEQIRSSSHLMIFICKNIDKKNWVEAGRSFQRTVLTATTPGISHAHLDMPCEVEPVRHTLSKLLGLAKGEQPVLLIRYGYDEEMPRSPRRSVYDLLIKEGEKSSMTRQNNFSTIFMEADDEKIINRSYGINLSDFSGICTGFHSS